MITKKEARNQIKEYRASMDGYTVDRYSQDITNKIIDMPEYRYSDIIYIYKSVNNEVDTETLINKALSDGKKVALPKVMEKEVVFYRVETSDELVFGYMGIPEPEMNPYKLMDKDEGLLIVPGLAFDLDFNRVGYGGGYYDRFMEKHPNVTKMAIAYEKQIFDKLQSEEHDIKVDFIITEKNTYSRKED